MKHIKLAIICLGLALTTMVATGAEAGRVKEPPKGSRTEKPLEMKKPHRFEKLPTMSFMSGILTRGAYSGWQVGETPLYLHKECVISGAGDGVLQEGQEAVVMGVMVGEAISAWSIYIPTTEYQPGGMSTDGLKEPGADPNVGHLVDKVD